MSDPIPPGDRSWSGPSRAARQDHAVLAWLVVEAGQPNDVHVRLVDALVAWAPLMGEHLFPTEPEAGVDADLHQVIGISASATEDLTGRQASGPYAYAQCSAGVVVQATASRSGISTAGGVAAPTEASCQVGVGAKGTFGF